MWEVFSLVSGTILLQTAWIQARLSLDPHIGQIARADAGVLVFKTRDVILLARILLGSTWIRKCSQTWVCRKGWEYVDGGLELARIRLDAEVCASICVFKCFICHHMHVDSKSRVCSSDRECMFLLYLVPQTKTWCSHAIRAASASSISRTLCADQPIKFSG